MLCYRCGGTGKYLGNGMIMADCKCDQYMKPSPLDNGIEVHKAAISNAVVDRRSKSYKKAINDIMSLNPDISKQDAVKMFDEAYVQV